MGGTLDNLAVHLKEKYDEIQTKVDQNQQKKISGPNGSSELCWELYPTHFGSKISSMRNVKLQKEENQNQPTKYGSIRKVVDTHTKEEQVQLDQGNDYLSLRTVESELKKGQNGSITKVETETEEEQIQLYLTQLGSTISKVVDNQIKEDPIQLNPTKYGAIRKVVETKTKKDQNQCNDAQYGFIRNNCFFPLNIYFHVSVHTTLNLKRPFLKFSTIVLGSSCF